jgi:hypothetical protein
MLNPVKKHHLCGSTPPWSKRGKEGDVHKIIRNVYFSNSSNLSAMLAQRGVDEREGEFQRADLKP